MFLPFQAQLLTFLLQWCGLGWLVHFFVLWVCESCLPSRGSSSVLAGWDCNSRCGKCRPAQFVWGTFLLELEIGDVFFKADSSNLTALEVPVTMRWVNEGLGCVVAETWNYVVSMVFTLAWCHREGLLEQPNAAHHLCSIKLYPFEIPCVLTTLLLC